METLNKLIENLERRKNDLQKRKPSPINNAKVSEVIHTLGKIEILLRGKEL